LLDSPALFKKRGKLALIRQNKRGLAEAMFPDSLLEQTAYFLEQLGVVKLTFVK
jgi:hypothetical protein